jgi:hypothetical protein
MWSVVIFFLSYKDIVQGEGCCNLQPSKYTSDWLIDRKGKTILAIGLYQQKGFQF